jgi:putative oxidoreductase
MRDHLRLFARLVLGGYMVVHGSQKLFGAFGGPGLEKAGGGFESMGLKPGREMARIAATTELGGGLLTATGLADPLGPMMIMGSMAVAAVSHRAKGPLAAKGGFELPLTDFTLAALTAAAGPGRFAINRPLPDKLTAVAAAGGAALAAISVAQLVRHRPPAPAPATPEAPAPSAGPTSSEGPPPAPGTTGTGPSPSPR